MREGDSGFAWRRLSWSFEEKKNNIINIAFKRYRWPHLKLDIGNFVKKMLYLSNY
jgi:hypothetical protein